MGGRHSSVLHGWHAIAGAPGLECVAHAVHICGMMQRGQQVPCGFPGIVIEYMGAEGETNGCFEKTRRRRSESMR